MTVGERIKKIRLEKGLTQKQLAEKCGLFDSTIRKYESGRQNPKIGTVEKIANALGVETSELLYEQSELIAQMKRMFDVHDVLNSTKAAFNLNVIDSMNNMFNNHPELLQEDTQPEEKSINDDTISKLETLNTLGQKTANLLIKRIDIKNKAVFNIQSTLSTVLGDIGCEGAQHILPEILFRYIFYIN